MTNTYHSLQPLRKWVLVATLSVYFLILVGGVVRGTGAGMGCPDWPRCFGQWVPPTHESQLPDNYKEHFIEGRRAKNEKLARMLSSLGLDDISQDITQEASLYEAEPFNATKTWIEYLNRLVGALVGLFIIVATFSAWKARKTDGTYFKWMLFILVLTLFQGWLGSIVVSTNLLPYTITVHMVLALVIVALLQYLYLKTRPVAVFQEKGQPLSYGITVVAIVLVVVQIVLGTQVREEIDLIKTGTLSRSLWIENIGIIFIVHRSFSWLLMVVVLWLGHLLFHNNKQLVFKAAGAIVAFVVVAEIALGVAMAWFDIPAWAQPLHLIFATLLAGSLFAIFVLLRQAKSASYKQKEFTHRMA